MKTTHEVTVKYTPKVNEKEYSAKFDVTDYVFYKKISFHDAGIFIQKPNLNEVKILTFKEIIHKLFNIEIDFSAVPDEVYLTDNNVFIYSKVTRGGYNDYWFERYPVINPTKISKEDIAAIVIQFFIINDISAVKGKNIIKNIFDTAGYGHLYFTASQLNSNTRKELHQYLSDNNFLNNEVVELLKLYNWDFIENNRGE